MALFQVEIGLRAMRDVRQNARRLRAAQAIGASKTARSGPTHLFLCIADHFEPQVGRAEKNVARGRLADWLTLYPCVADKFHDREGRVPAHTFFYPWDEYDAEEFHALARLCRAGYGEIEVHLHHRDDTDASLRAKLRAAVCAYQAGGALSCWPDGRAAWGFVHGNWALDNSRHENGRNFCGVNNELTILREEGCYADYTFPAWPQSAQPRQTNSIFYALDDPLRPKSYDRGKSAQAGRRGTGDLLLIQGPLVPYRRRGKGVPVAVDDGDLASYRRYAPARLDRWVRAGVHVSGQASWVFIKLHCHGAADANRALLLQEDLAALFRDAHARYNDGKNYCLHYVTAREMFNLVKAAEEQPGMDVARARDWLLPRPPD